MHFWGFLIDRVDARIAVSPMAAESAARWHARRLPRHPERRSDPGPGRAGEPRRHVVFVGRHDPRKGLPILLRAWPEIHAATGARLRLIGTDPLQYRLLHARMRFDEAGIDVLGIVTNEVRTHELLRGEGVRDSRRSAARASASCSPRRSRARRPPSPPTSGATRPSRRPSRRVLVPPGDPDAARSRGRRCALPTRTARVEMGRAARVHAQANYSWDDIARRLEEIYDEVVRVMRARWWRVPARASAARGRDRADRVARAGLACGARRVHRRLAGRGWPRRSG